MPCGPLSSWLIIFLSGGRPGPVPSVGSSGAGDPLRSADLQLALWCCHEMSCRGFDGISVDEHSPELVAFRSVVSGALESALRAEVPAFTGGRRESLAVLEAAGRDASALAMWVAAHGDERIAADLVTLLAPAEQRPPDPALLGVPRLQGGAKSALLTVAFDGSGDGSAQMVRAAAFASLGARRDAIERVPAEALAVANLPWLFGLERRLRHALCGYVAARSAAGAMASPRLAGWAARAGGLPVEWFSLRAAADLAHDEVVRSRLLPALDDEAVAEVVFGARAYAALQCRLAAVAVGAWHAGTSPIAGDEGAGLAAA